MYKKGTESIPQKPRFAVQVGVAYYVEDAKTVKERHNFDCWILAATIAARVPLGITGRICAKSPPRITAIPPKLESDGKSFDKDCTRISLQEKKCGMRIIYDCSVNDYAFVLR